MNRPDVLNQICLADSAAWFEYTNKMSREHIRMGKGKGSLIIRSSLRVIRYT